MRNGLVCMVLSGLFLASIATSAIAAGKPKPGKLNFEHSRDRAAPKGGSKLAPSQSKPGQGRGGYKKTR